MMSLDAFLTRLKRRFDGLNDDVLTVAITDGISALGYGGVENVPTVDAALVMAYVSYELATDLATNAANYFSYTDGSEAVDKSNIMENYAKLADRFKSEYEAELAKREAAAAEPLPIFHIMKRVDRV